MPRSRNRAAFARYAALGAVFVTLLAVVFASFATLFDQRRLIETDSKINIWFLAQAEIEYLRLMEGLTTFAAGSDAVSKDEISIRFEIFWSRLLILTGGPQAALLRRVGDLVSTTEALVGVLEEIEPQIDQLDRGDLDAIWRVHNSLEAFRIPLHEIVQNGLTYDTDISSSERQTHAILYYQLVALFAAIVLASFVLFAMLYRQMEKTKRLFFQANEAQEAASAARKHLAEAIESISEGFVLFDENDCIVLLNEKYRELHDPIADMLHVGTTFEQILREAARRGVVEVPQQEIEEWIAKCMEAHRNPTGAFESKLSNGRWLKISERRTDDGRLVGVHTDITALKLREIELSQKSALLEATIESTIQGIAVFDQSSRLLVRNKNYLGMHGLSIDDAQPGRTYEQILRHNAARGEYGEGDIEGHIRESLKRVEVLKESGSGRVQLERRRPNGRVLEVIMSPMPGGGFIKTYSDITDRVEGEAERARLLDQFHAGQKMQAIGTLAGGIAHDFNNILGSIIGYTYLLLEDAPEDHPFHGPLQHMLKAGDRAKHLVQQILTYSRNEEFELNPIDLAAVCTETLEMLRASVPGDVKVLGGNWASAPIDGDATQIHQIIQNLVINAAHAIGGSGGVIAVSVEQVEAGQLDRELPISSTETKREQRFWTVLSEAGAQVRMRVGALEPGPYCRLKISDTGCGMDRATMTRMFEPFFTTKEVGKGTGLGLAAVHGIVRNHGGAIFVESVVDRGTTFEVWFPCSSASAGAEPSEEVSGSAPGHSGQGQVLLVEDDEILLEMTERKLARSGYTVVPTTRGAEAMEIFRAAPDLWDIVITDRTMPLMTGEEMAEKMLKIRPDIPVIMCTGFTDAAAVEQALALGIREVLMKPVIGQDLVNAVQRVLAGRNTPQLSQAS
jgi:signal transduction histidine kinase/CheY-like chemotaxis protein